MSARNNQPHKNLYIILFKKMKNFSWTEQILCILSYRLNDDLFLHEAWGFDVITKFLGNTVWDRIDRVQQIDFK